MNRYSCKACYRLDAMGKIDSFLCSPLGWSSAKKCDCRKGCHKGAKEWARGIRQGRAA